MRRREELKATKNKINIGLQIGGLVEASTICGNGDGAGQVDRTSRDDAAFEFSTVEDRRRDPFGAEGAAIAARRDLYGVPAASPRCGLALSGGGIRSATFSLGLLRGLSSLGLLQKIDYLSTVSGGGYSGAFYCGLFAKRGATAAILDMTRPATGETHPDDLLGRHDARKALAYLRQSGRYLTPSGGRDFVYALAMLARNWLALTLVLGMAIVCAEMVLDWIRHLLIGSQGVVAGLHQPQWLQLARQFYWISPLVLLVPVLGAVIFAAGWAYWLTVATTPAKWKQGEKPAIWPLSPPFVGSLLISVVTGAAVVGLIPQVDLLVKQICGVVLVLALLALAMWMVASWPEPRSRQAVSPSTLAMQQDRIRGRLGQWQAWIGQVLLAVVILTLADSATYLLVWLTEPLKIALDDWRLALPPLMTLAIPASQWLLKRLATLPKHDGRASAGQGAPKPGWLARLGPLLAAVTALLLTITALSFWGSLAHILAWNGLDGKPCSNAVECTPYALSGHFAWGLIGSALFVALASFTYGFVNLSSLSSFYADRLCRAYLGAGNRERLGLNSATGEVQSVHECAEGDDTGLESYFRNSPGAPVHLINVTINETHGKGPATVQRDRHGLNLVVSPAGVSWLETPGDPITLKALGHVQFNEWQNAQASPLPPETRPGQSLPLSVWIGISGAAFTTGLGSATSLAKSTLAFLANVRLGYWWSSDRTRRFPGVTYHRLYSEMIASFPGTAARQWYLSDGGHFENTGVYELIRRKVPFIVLTDNGCDPHYGFEDIANLVRKARIDFGAEITFLGESALERVFSDSQKDLHPLFAGPAGFAGKHPSPHAIAMLGEVDYGEGAHGTLLVIKPRLSDDGPADLMRYKADNFDFPQQTTLDQFFDEAQWESYYELGRLMVCKLFKERLGVGWQPYSMAPIPRTAAAPGIEG